MNFYHYTSVTLAESILASGLNNGHVWRANGAIESPIVWLTSDQSHEGHGLLTGAEKYGEKERDYAERVTGIRPKNDFVPDKTRIRIKIRLSSSDRHLSSYVKYCMNNGDGRYWSKLMGLSAWYNLKEIDPTKLPSLIELTYTKEQSWYLYFGTISPCKIIEIEYRTENGMISYDFDSHGRAQMIFEGQIPLSITATQHLQGFFKPRFGLDRISAIVQYFFHEKTPILLIRGCGIQFLVDIVQKKVFSETVPNNVSDILDWTEIYKEELLQCYDLATERFFFFNPNLAPT